MKKIVAMMLALLLTLCLVGGAMAEADGKIQLGTSSLSIVAPGYVMGEVTEEDIADDQVAYYYSEESLLDFDVYQWNKEGKTLEEEIAEEAEGKEVTSMEINGIAICAYDDVEESEDVEYNTKTLMMEDGEDFVEIVFWLDGENAVAEMEAILNTLAR